MGRYGSDGLGPTCSVWVRFGDTAEGDFEAEGAELADVVGDLAADVTGGTAAIFHAGTAPRRRYQGLIRRSVPARPASAPESVSAGQRPDERTA